MAKRVPPGQCTALPAGARPGRSWGMRSIAPVAVLLFMGVVRADVPTSTGVVSAWTPLATGVEHATFVLDPEAKTPALLHVVRIDPARARLAFGLASRDGRGPRTAEKWCADLK